MRCAKSIQALMLRGTLLYSSLKGNNYRLIVDIVYLAQRIYIKYVLTHADYDKEAWKNDPYY
jgi:mRNA interferase HigB